MWLSFQFRTKTRTVGPTRNKNKFTTQIFECNFNAIFNGDPFFFISGVIHGEKKRIAVAVHTMKAHEGSGGIALPFLVSTLVGGKCSIGPAS